jgi:prolipoprotein diacylglyceryltransferase
MEKMMPDILQLGPFIIKSSWLSIAVGFFIGLQIMKSKLKKVEVDQEKLVEHIFSGILITLIIWKFGPLATDPSMLWNNPWGVLYTTGAGKHLLAGATIAIIYLYLKIKRENIALTIVFDAFPFAFLPMVGLYYLVILDYGKITEVPWGISIGDPAIAYHPVHLYKAIVVFVLFLRLWTSPQPLGQLHVFKAFLCFYGIGLMAVSLFELQTVAWAGISRGQLLYLIMFITGTLLPARSNREFG